MFHDVCVLSCYGLRDPHIASFVNTLGAALERRGIRLLVLSATAEPELDCLFVEIPYLLSQFDQALHDIEQDAFHPIVATMLSEEDQAAGAQDEATIARGIAKCEAFYATIGTVIKPCVALLWNTTLPHGRIARNTLAAMGVPSYCLERGWLPQSYQLHTTENNGYNDFFTDFTLNQSLPRMLAMYGDLADPFVEAQAYYRAHAVQKYEAGAKLEARALRDKYALGDAKLIVVFAASVGSSVGSHQMPSMAFSSPLFEGVSTALHLLYELLKPYPGVKVLVQEHPIQRAINKPAVLPPGFLRTDGENIHTLLEAADQYAFIGTTSVQIEALLHDKPRLSMSRHAASVTGASYGLVEEGDSAIAAWMDHTRADACRFNARALINYLCLDRLIGDADVPPFIEHNVEHLADFIAQLSRPDSMPGDERIQAFIDRIGVLLK
ncbi:MAG: hypothetical protein WKG03_05195 [Telluria sp.]